MNLSAPELILILVVILLLFGAKRLPDTARSLGRSMRIFKAETKNLNDDPDAPVVTPVAPPAQIAGQPVYQQPVGQPVYQQPVAQPVYQQPVAQPPVQPAPPQPSAGATQAFPVVGDAERRDG